MSFVYNKNLNQLALKVLLWIVVLKFLNTVAIYFLPKYSTYKVSNQSLDLPYFSIRIDKSFKANKKPKETKIDLETLYPITDLTLKAIYGNADNKNSSFIMVIPKNEKSTKFLSIGDSIKKYKLTDIKIKDKEAIFKNGSKQYILRMDSIKNKKTPAFSNRVASGSSNTKQNFDDVILAVPRGEVLRYRKNFKDIWKNISISEVVKNGKIYGFVINHIELNTIFGRLGLKAGDIIRSVNNNTIRSYADAFKIYYTIERAKALKITVLRNNKEKELEYEIY